jgi:outer membrane protein TolC
VLDRTAGEIIDLSLQEAIQRGLRFNLGVINASVANREAESQRIATLGDLLPHVSVSANEVGAKADLRTEGLSADIFKTSPALGAVFPETVGPYHYYSLQANLSANILSVTALNNYRSARLSANMASLNALDARELVVLAVAASYMQVLASNAEIAAQTAQVNYVKAAYDQARAQAEVGTIADIDAARELVQLQTEQLRLRSEEAEVKKQLFALNRLIGLQVTTQVHLTDHLNENASISVNADQAVQQAFHQRQDLKAQEARVRAAEAALKAARSERLPAVSIQGYYGVQGTNPDHGRGVFSMSGGVSVPVFDGNRIRADVGQATADLDLSRAQLEDLQGAVELQVRSAYSDLEVAAGQVDVARTNQDLALTILRQSEDRFASGATDSVEVVQSQQVLGTAAHDYVSALYALNLARLSFARSIGEAEHEAIELIKER